MGFKNRFLKVVGIKGNNAWMTRNLLTKQDFELDRRGNFAGQVYFRRTLSDPKFSNLWHIMN